MCGKAIDGRSEAMPGYASKKEDHLKRLRRIEGQIRGLQRMVENDEYCIDVLTQVSAATKALQGFALELLDQHMHHCVTDAISGGAGCSLSSATLSDNAATPRENLRLSGAAVSQLVLVGAHQRRAGRQ
jgi:DNA-binding FrmR family transcriptional regulator